MKKILIAVLTAGVVLATPVAASATPHPKGECQKNSHNFRDSHGVIKYCWLP